MYEPIRFQALIPFLTVADTRLMPAFTSRDPVIGGMTAFSTCDYPDHLACTFFVQGCPWQCGYCHNPHLQPRQGNQPLEWSQLLAWLTPRRGLLDAVVFSGGEPTMDPHLEDALQQVRALGFKIGLHTAGMYPERFQAVLPLVDWVGFDIKHTWQQYDQVTLRRNSAARVAESLTALLNANIAYECRTTIHPQLHGTTDLFRLVDALYQQYAVQHFHLQVFRSQGCQTTDLCQPLPAPYPSPELIEYAQSMFATFSVRQA